MKKNPIPAIVISATVIMSLSDAFLVPSYFYKSLFKVLLFLMIPLICLVKLNKLNDLKHYFAFKKKAIIPSLCLALAVFALIILAFFIARNWLDLNAIKDNLTKGIGVNAANFVYVALYITFCNSLLEEFFFRIFAFKMSELKAKGAYLFSALTFALYHAGMIGAWFNPIIYFLTLSSLFVAGLIFDSLLSHYDSVYPSLWYIWLPMPRSIPSALSYSG